MGGFLKALILPSKYQEPFFSVKVDSRNYYACCQTCVQNQYVQECTHESLKRAVEITTTIEAMEYALSIGNCEIYKFLEIWNFDKKETILRDYVCPLLDFREMISKTDIQASKYLNRCMQVTYGKLAQKPIQAQEKLIDNLAEFENVLHSQNVSNVCK